MQTIPIGLRGLDLLASAETGSGKTAAFLIPMIVRLMSLKDVATGPLGLILAPTRELAQQIFVEAQKLGVGTGLQFRCTIGGTNLDDQVELLQKAAYHVLIGTPGRVLDLLTQEFAVLHDCRWLVLDEADRMIDHGFTEQLMAILEFLPKRASDEGAVHQRQTAMYS
ncbi:MAG: DEAD/DEAH box helicase, partial [Mycobacteriaceae bacterium]|nr:DEAD/DEAH box helicase [Mycobacteriaceae bacterium]